MSALSALSSHVSIGASMTLPVFNFFDLPSHPALFRSLQSLGPERAWDVMSELSEADLPHYRAQDSPAGEPTLEQIARRAMARAPRLDRELIADEARRFEAYPYRMQLDSYFLALWLNDPEALFRCIDLSGTERLLAEASRRRGVILLPLHIGPSYAAPLLFGHLHPTTFVYNRANVDDLRPLAFPDLDVEAVPLAEGGTYRSALRALARGRVFSMYPEVDPRGKSRHHTAVQVFGAELDVPLGPAILSRASGSAMMPVTLERADTGGHYRLQIHEPIAAPTTSEECVDRTVAVWRLIESELERTGFGDWEIWYDFERMLTDGEDTRGH